ncbi:MAG: helix-turn-helix transcriptional regulator [Defluviitaleaceae bacterium]|nr:helix-turn-helix transcriptional regulator [Defluviitaleaceae bacterium]MCL2276013.1 helix-turn-helix transcriptional regulator [Defluviitaleaceae bacterium]
MRKQNGFTQEELAEKLKIPRTISEWESGHTRCLYCAVRLDTIILD